VNPLTVVRSRISRAATTTTTSFDARSSRTRAEFIEAGRRAGTSKEVTSLTLTPGERIRITIVVRNVPTSRFEDGKSEFGGLHLVNKSGSHDFVGELSSFKVRTSGTRGTRVFHISTLEIRTSEVLSESGS